MDVTVDEQKICYIPLKPLQGDIRFLLPSANGSVFGEAIKLTDIIEIQLLEEN